MRVPGVTMGALILLASISCKSVAGVPSADLRWLEGSGVPERSFWDVHFIDDVSGWAAGPGGAVIGTTDGGRTWRSLPGSDPKGYWRSVRFLDAKRGFVIGGMAAPEWFAESKLGYTEDGGQTWADQTPPSFTDRPPEQYIRIQFFNSKEGLIFGTRLLSTRDGGRTWSVVPAEGARSYYNPSFVSLSRGWAMKDSRLWKTTDGGVTWQEDSAAWAVLSEFEQQHVWLNSVHFTDDERGWALTGGDEFLRTTDGGRTWERLGRIHPGKVEKFCFVDPDHGWALVHQEALWSLFRTQDGGAHWTESYGTKTRLTGMMFLRPDQGWVCGDGVVLRLGSGPGAP